MAKKPGVKQNELCGLSNLGDWGEKAILVHEKKYVGVRTGNYSWDKQRKKKMTSY